MFAASSSRKPAHAVAIMTFGSGGGRSQTWPVGEKGSGGAPIDTPRAKTPGFAQGSEPSGAAPGTALRTGLYLAQAGEFGFVLLTLGADGGLLAPQWVSPVLASMVLSMLATPFIVMYSNRIVARLSATDWMLQSVALTTIAKKSIASEAHVIICGYGRSGQNLARLLDGEQRVLAGGVVLDR